MQNYDEINLLNRAHRHFNINKGDRTYEYLEHLLDMLKLINAEVVAYMSGETSRNEKITIKPEPHALDKLSHLAQNEDKDGAHLMADHVLCDLLIELGYLDVVDAYKVVLSQKGV